MRFRSTFQFTHPGRGATIITIEQIGTTGFNSRTPGGVRHTNTNVLMYCHKFQFTHPGRGATYTDDYVCM